MILDIITNAEDEQYEENLLIIKDAYQCLSKHNSIHNLLITNFFDTSQLCTQLLGYRQESVVVKFIARIQLI